MVNNDVKGMMKAHGEKDTSSPLIISNCRLEGDGQSRGNFLHLVECAFGSGGLSISDTQIVNTSSSFSLKAVSGVKPIVVSRSAIVHGSLKVDSGVVTREDPLLIVDCTLNRFGMSSNNNSPDFLFVGTVFHTFPNTSTNELLRIAGPCFVIFQSCLFDECETRNGLIVCSNSVSLTMDACSVKECKTTGSSSSPFSLTDTAFQAYSCMFANLTGISSSMFAIKTNGSVLLEDCRFDLATSHKTDILFSKASPSLLNTSSVVGCTSNREISVTIDWRTFTVCPLFNVIQTPTAKTEIKLEAGTDENGNPIETMDTLWPTIQLLEADSSTLLLLSDGSFTENGILSIQTDVEIVGSGTESVHVTLDESPRPHTTLLTAELEVGAGANLTLRSMTLVPSSLSSPLVTMKEDGLLSVKNVVVREKQNRPKELFSLSAGTTRFSHSRFSSIAGSTALIVVSGTGSMSLSDTLFLTISRTHTESVNGSVQSGSCVDANMSGLILITFCKFGGCSSNGRAGAIDIVSNDTTSRVEMEGCKFDENPAGSELNEEAKGDDVVLKGFSDEQRTLNFTALNPSPHSLSSSMIPIHTFLRLTLSTFLRNDSTCHSRGPLQTCSVKLVSIITDFKYTEAMTPFSLRNVYSLHTLQWTAIRFTLSNGTLTRPFIDSTGRSTLFTRVTIDTDLSLNGVSFVRHIRSTNDGIFTWEHTSVTSVSLTTQPFLHLEGMRTLDLTSSLGKPIQNFNTSCDGSFQFAKKSNVTLSTLNVSSCSSKRGGFAFCHLCNVSLRQCEFSSCSAQHGGVIFVERDNAYRLSTDHDSRIYTFFSGCEATAMDENGVAVGRGGVIYVKGTTTAKTPLQLTFCTFDNNTAAFGNDVFVEKSVLGENGPDCLRGCKGESQSGWPHLEVEGITKEGSKDEWTRIATFIDYPQIQVRASGTDNTSCRFSNSACKTLTYYDVKRTDRAPDLEDRGQSSISVNLYKDQQFSLPFIGSRISITFTFI
ncbi:hypothetical protein BLNAU_21289 [Blattamonas nauphoetae]|uniref:Uncharacterized protein n=1 Tax=Blattamonas nauphoetae TaxID=2049346 RepID=A0ABQ9WWC1_9EUKA|nr:hypothetical protein BLNAU_21289 [Blattamonas nauphoetae]